MQNKKLENTPFKAGSANAGKAPYGKPELRIFGSVRTLTKGGQGTKADGMNKSQKK